MSATHHGLLKCPSCGKFAREAKNPLCAKCWAFVPPSWRKVFARTRQLYRRREKQLQDLLDTIELIAKVARDERARGNAVDGVEN